MKKLFASIKDCIVNRLKNVSCPACTQRRRQLKELKKEYTKNRDLLIEPRNFGKGILFKVIWILDWAVIGCSLAVIIIGTVIRLTNAGDEWKGLLWNIVKFDGALLVLFFLAMFIESRRAEYKNADPKQLRDARMIGLETALENFAIKSGLEGSWDAWLYFYNKYPFSLCKSILIGIVNAYMTFIMVMESPSHNDNPVVIILLLGINLLVTLFLERASKAIHASGFEKLMLKDYPKWILKSSSIQKMKKRE